MLSRELLDKVANGSLTVEKAIAEQERLEKEAAVQKFPMSVELSTEFDKPCLELKGFNKRKPLRIYGIDQIARLDEAVKLLKEAAQKHASKLTSYYN